MNYKEFINKKAHLSGNFGFKPTFMPDYLFDFQKYLVEWALLKGRSAVFADCGLGKGQPGNSKILSNNGWIKYKDIKVGNIVFSSDGKKRNVIGVFPKNEIDTYRFFYSDRTSSVFDIDHIHICRTNNDRQRNNPWKTMTTKELACCGKIRYGKGGKSRTFDIPLVKPVQFDQKKVEIDPYLLGVLLGDGNLSGNVIITNSDFEIIERCDSKQKNIKFKKITDIDYRIITGRNGCKRHKFRQDLINYGLYGKRSHEKFIPKEYLYNSVENRIELLRGLMDTDSYIRETIQYYTTSFQLKEDVVFLLRSLGANPTQSKKQGKYKDKNGKIVECKMCYVITYSIKNINPFYLKRRADKWNPNPRDNGRWIDRIEYEGKQKTICISVDSPDNSYVVENFVVTHNTIIQLVWAQNIVEKTNKRVLILAPLAVSMQTKLEAKKFGMDIDIHELGKNKITVTNYQKLKHYNKSDFVGVVCDESSILKNFKGAIKEDVTDFMKKIPYRLLATATAAPNDYIELGTSSESIGELGFMDMLNRFFKNDLNNSGLKRMYGEAPKWRFKGYAEKDFWRWVCSWSRSCRFPSDLGFSDEGYILPELKENSHIVVAKTLPDGCCLPLPAKNLDEQRKERKRTVKERCEKVAELVYKRNGYSIVWCHLNSEGDYLEKIIKDSVQVAGKNTDEQKEDRLFNFAKGNIRCLIIKPKIGAFGLNFQHCNHITYFPSHSYEQYYQAGRRCWRFGQKRKVDIDIVMTEGDELVMKNMKRKSKQAIEMFGNLVKNMNNELKIKHVDKNINKMAVPKWL